MSRDVPSFTCRVESKQTTHKQSNDIKYKALLDLARVQGTKPIERMQTPTQRAATSSLQMTQDEPSCEHSLESSEQTTHIQSTNNKYKALSNQTRVRDTKTIKRTPTAVWLSRAHNQNEPRRHFFRMSPRKNEIEHSQIVHQQSRQGPFKPNLSSRHQNNQTGPDSSAASNQNEPRRHFFRMSRLERSKKTTHK